MGEHEARESERLVLEAAAMHDPEQRGLRKKLLKKAASLGNLEAEFELGWVYVAEGSLAKAKEHFQTSTAGGVPSPFAGLAHVQEMEGDLVGAESSFAQAAHLGLDVRWELARVWAGLGKTVPARKMYEELARENRPEAINELGLFLQREGKNRQAEKRWKQAAKLGNLDAKANLGRIVIQSNFKNRRYRHHLNDAVDARHPGIINMLGMQLAEDGRLGEAQRVWETAAELGDENAHRNLGKLARENGDEKLALEWEKLANTPNAEGTGKLLQQHGLFGNADDEGSGREEVILPDAPVRTKTPFWVFLVAFLLVSGLVRYFFA